jgi:hypothetical protein
MARNYAFTVSKSEGATSHEVKVLLPDTFTAAQTKNLVEEGLKSVRIKVQGTLRRRLSQNNPVKPGEPLNREAQAAFDAVLNGTRPEAAKQRFDCVAMKFTRAQVDLMVANGAEVYNIPANLK